MEHSNVLECARQVLDIEIEGLQSARNGLDDSFVAVVKCIMQTLHQGGKVVVTGVGKNLHVAEKISATLASTGTTSVVMNPIQAMHGDLGMITAHDVLLALSFSGESEEIIKLIPAVHRLGARVIAMVGDCESTLAHVSDMILFVRVLREACPFGMAPTATTTATMAVGDALAMVLIKQRQFSKEHYAKLHPAGAIGRALLMRVKDIMRTGAGIAELTLDATIKDAVMAMTASQSGAALIVDHDRRLAGIFTDGDLRRHLSMRDDILEVPICDVMTKNPLAIGESALAVEVLRIFEQHKIDDLPVVDAQRQLCGYVDIQDLPKMKVL